MSFGSGGEVICPLCGEKVPELRFKLHLAFEKKQIQEIADDHPGWAPENGACLLCMNLYRQHNKLPPLAAEEFSKLI